MVMYLGRLMRFIDHLISPWLKPGLTVAEIIEQEAGDYTKRRKNALPFYKEDSQPRPTSWAGLFRYFLINRHVQPISHPTVARSDKSKVSQLLVVLHRLSEMSPIKIS